MMKKFIERGYFTPIILNFHKELVFQFFRFIFFSWHFLFTIAKDVGKITIECLEIPSKTDV